MKNILVLAHDDSGQEARLQVALDLARLLGGHLTFVDVTYAPPMVGSGYYENAYVMADLMVEESTRETANRKKMEQRLAAEDINWDWIDATGTAAGCLERLAGLADVIVVNRALSEGCLMDMRAEASDLIVGARRPVMAVPSTCRRLELDAALVGWDGSPCAIAALRASIPLLRLTSKVILLEIEDGSVKLPAEEAAKYLSRHNVHVTVDRTNAGRRNAGDILLDKLRRYAFSYAVLGGFSHARFIEAVFGGVTRSMLTESPVPVLFAR